MIKYLIPFAFFRFLNGHTRVGGPSTSGYISSGKYPNLENFNIYQSVYIKNVQS